MKKRFGRILKLLLKLVAVVALAAALAIGALWTSPGKAFVARTVEKLASRYLDGEVRLGKLAGNYLRHLNISGLELRDARGHVLARVANVGAEYSFTSFVPPRLVIRRLQLEQPRVTATADARGVLDWSRLVKKKETEPEKKKAKTDAEPAVWLRELKIVEGRIEYRRAARDGKIATVGDLYPVNVALELPRSFERLPEGRAVALGQYEGLPVKLALRVHAAEPGALGQRLSAVAKRPFDAQAFALLVKAGDSVVEATGEGEFDLRKFSATNATVRLDRLHAAGGDLKRISRKLPARPVEARAQAELLDGKVSAAFESHFAEKSKLYAKARLEEGARGRKLVLEELRLAGKKCELLRLSRKTTLELAYGESLPYGQIELKGCGGLVRYEHVPGHGLFARVEKLMPARFMEALALAPPAGEITDVNALIELPRGVRLAQGFVQASAEYHKGLPGELLPSVFATFQAELKRGGAAAVLGSLKFKDSALQLAGDFRNLFAPGGGWRVDRERATGRLRLAAERFDLGALKSLGLVEKGMTGALEASLAVSGSLARSRVTLEAEGKGLGVASGKGGKVDARTTRIDTKVTGSYDSRKLELVAQARPAESDDKKTENGGGGAKPLRRAVAAGEIYPVALEASAELDQRALLRDGRRELREAPLEWHLVARELDLERLLSTVRYPTFEQEKVRLTAELDARGAGTLAKPEAKGRLELRSGDSRLAEATGELKSSGALSGALVAKNASTDALIKAVTNMAATEKGRLDADFQVAGTLESPRYGGYVRLHADKFRLPTLGTSYDDLKIRISGNQRNIFLDDLSARSGEGRLAAHGGIALDDAKSPAALRFVADFSRFEALASEQMRVEASGQLDVRANRADSIFSGNLDIAEGTVTIPERAGKKTESLKPLQDVVYASTKDVSSAAQKSSLLAGIHGGIDVHMPGQFWIKSKSGDIAVELSSELRVGLDEDSEPTIEGTVETRRGSVEFFGRYFEVRRGLVEFRGEPRNPRVNAEAFYKSSPSSIVVAVNGNVDNLKPQLSSDPPGLSEEQAIGVLLTGNPDFQSTGGGGGRSVTGVATGFLVGELKQKLGPKLPFDTLRADINTDQQSTGAAPTTEENRSKIEVGKYITDKIFVKLGRAFATGDDEAMNRLTVDYRLSDKWSIETTQTDTGRSDLEVLWTLNY